MLLAMLLLLWTDIPIDLALEDTFASFMDFWVTVTNNGQWNLHRMADCFCFSICIQHRIEPKFLDFWTKSKKLMLGHSQFESATFVLWIYRK